MKALKPLFYNILLLSLVCCSLSTTSFAQKNKDKITTGLLNDRFIFKAQTANPARGGLINLTPEYDLRISKDTIAAYLPYYGRAYAPIDPNEDGIHFTSTSFKYKIKERKKGKGWEIEMEPLDVKEIQQMNLLVSPDGYAMLQVTSVNRQIISFNGYITTSK